MSKGKEKNRKRPGKSETSYCRKVLAVYIDLHYAGSNCNDCITGISDSHTIKEKHDGNGRK